MKSWWVSMQGEIYSLLPQPKVMPYENIEFQQLAELNIFVEVCNGYLAFKCVERERDIR